MEISNLTGNKLIIVLQGGSGSGKTSLATYLTTLGIPRVVTCTTRQPKKNEKNGVDYFFFRDRESFLANDLIEYEEYSGNLYGTRKQEVKSALNQYDTICLILEKKGAVNLKTTYPKNTLLLTLPIEEEDMINNMKQRGDSEKLIKERLKNVEKCKEDEASIIHDYTLCGNDLEEKKYRIDTLLIKEGILKCDKCGKVSREVRMYPDVERKHCLSAFKCLCDKCNTNL